MSKLLEQLKACNEKWTLRKVLDIGLLPTKEAYEFIGVMNKRGVTGVLDMPMNSLVKLVEINELGMTRDEFMQAMNEVHEGPWSECPICKKPMNRKGHSDCKIEDVFDTDGFTSHELANILLQMPDVVVATDESDVIRVVAKPTTIYLSIFPKDKGNLD